jgi:rare lipoprotein A
MALGTRHAANLLIVLACAASLGACSLAGRRAPPPPSAVPPGAAPANVPPSTPPGDVLAVPDAVPHPEPRARNGNPPFYDVLGHRYFVLASAEGYVERGVASWYGPTFHGVATAMGETYDMYAMTAAHKTLPLPAYARVTNLRNGRSIVVRINDRGPFVANRLIDLSYTAAAKLDMLRDGTTLVEVRAISPGEPAAHALTRAVETPPQELFIQAGAFAEPGNAQRLYERLRAAGLEKAFVMAPTGAQHLYRVRVGPVASVSDFDALSARLAELGIHDARLALD